MGSPMLHVVCGNCGCNSMFTFGIIPEGHCVSGDEGGTEDRFEPAVWLECGKCSTIYDLWDVMPAKVKAAKESETE